MRVCLIGATHPCHNPRLIREADSLSAAGHDVRVIAPSFVVDLRDRDRRLMEQRKWHLETVDYCPDGLAGTYRAYATRGLRRLFEEVFRLTKDSSLVDRAYTPALAALASAAGAQPADWFIAHTHRALPVAAGAARNWNSRLGFDCEDLSADTGFDYPEIVRLIEKNYLPLCNYVSVPSKATAEELSGRYGMREPLVLSNFFPISLVNGLPPPNSRSSRSVVRLYWFSQTIGEGRGIEDALQAASMLGSSVELHLRGNWMKAYEQTIRNMSNQLKIVLHVHAIVDHDDLIQQMEAFDIGLALEPLTNRNAALTQSNKIGSYLLAGLAIAATDTPGQREVLEQAPRVGFLYPPGKPELLAAGLKRWIDDRNALRDSQQAAWDIARERFCWDVEKEKFFAVLQN